MLAAFITGLVGSLHCVGMCGPIALALPMPQNGRAGWQYFLGRLLYNVGRLTSYSILGGIVALLGVAAALFDIQRWFSLGLGVILIVLAMAHFGLLGAKSLATNNIWNRWWRKAMGEAMKLRGLGGLFVLGLLNGVLPCGLVYAGLFLAANSSTMLEGMAKMAAFGLGTLPLMLTLSWSGKWLRSWLQAKSRWIMPSLMLGLAMMFFLRGMALGIPYLSPRLEQSHITGEVKMSCCEKIKK